MENCESLSPSTLGNIVGRTRLRHNIERGEVLAYYERSRTTMNRAMDVIDQLTKEVAALKLDNECLRVRTGLPVTQDEVDVNTEEENGKDEPVTILNMCYDHEAASDSDYLSTQEEEEEEEEEEGESSDSESGSDIETVIPVEEAPGGFTTANARWKSDQLKMWGASTPKDTKCGEDPAWDSDDIVEIKGETANEINILDRQSNENLAPGSNYIPKDGEERGTGDEVTIFNMECDADSASDSEYVPIDEVDATGEYSVMSSSLSSDEDEAEHQLDSKELDFLRREYHTALNTLLTPEHMYDQIIKPQHSEPKKPPVLLGGDGSNTGSPTWSEELIAWPEDYEDQKSCVVSNKSEMDWTEVYGKYDEELEGHKYALNQEDDTDL